MAYHTNTAGISGLCKAEKGGCPFGGESGVENHYATLAEAQNAYEEGMAKHQFTTLNKITPKWRRNLTKVGSAVLATVALTNVGSIAAHATPSQAGLWDELTSDSSYSEEYTSTLDSIEKFLNENTEHGSKFKEERSTWGEFFGDKGASSTSPSNNSDYSTEGVYFQGKSLNVTPEEFSTAKAQLDGITVAPESNGASYNRTEQFGRSFKTGVAGKTERRDVTEGIFKNDSPQARAIDGSFIDPYTGESITVSTKNNNDTNIEHLVPTKEAYVSGASEWSQQKREDFANDIDANLAIVSASANKSKQDKDPAEWMPSYAPSHDRYIVNYVNVKDKYDLKMDSAEYNFINDYLATR